MWEVSYSGHPDAVSEAFKKRKIVGDQSQFEMVQAFVEHELSFHTASRGGGVTVKATGHHGPEGRSLSIIITPIELVLDEEVCRPGILNAPADTKRGRKPTVVT